MDTQKLLVIGGGVIAVVGQFWGAMYFLPLIGGALAVIGGFME
jgi:hypothetical protein